MLREISRSEKDKDRRSSIRCGILKRNKTRSSDREDWGCQRWGAGGEQNGSRWPTGANCQLRAGTIYSVVTTVPDAMYLQVVQRTDLKNSQHKIQKNI